MKTKFTKANMICLALVMAIAFLGLNEANGQWNASGNNIYNTNTGNVGIGNSSPTTLLHVQKNMTEPSITVQNLGGTGGASFTMIDNTSGANWKFKATLDGGFKIRDHANLLDVFVIEPNSAANALYIDSTGNVGIGTTDPQHYKLFVARTASTDEERAVANFRNNDNSTGSLCNVYISSGDSGSTYLNYVAPSYIHQGGKYKMHTMLGNNGKGLVFRTGYNDEGRIAFEFRRELENDYTYDEKVSITYDGNMWVQGKMGIGTTTPESKLHVVGRNIQLSTHVFLGQFYSNCDLLLGSNMKSIDYENTGGAIVANDWPEGYSGIQMKHGDIRFHTKAGQVYAGDPASNVQMRIDPNGNVGIGTSTPQRRLHINDVMRLEPRSTAPGSPSEGDIYMDATSHVLKVYNGTEWKACW